MNQPEQRPQGADDEVRALAPRQADTAGHAREDNHTHRLRGGSRIL